LERGMKCGCEHGVNIPPRAGSSRGLGPELAAPVTRRCHRENTEFGVWGSE
jgi:hypothetical protein